MVRRGRIVTMNPRRQILDEGSVAIDGGKIVAVGTEANEVADEVVDARGKVILPGLINGHTHPSMTLLRGVADDMSLMEWLSKKVWPVEKKMKPHDCSAGAMLGCLEMLKSGTTCFADQYFHMEEVARAVDKAGIRGVLSYGMIDREDAERRDSEIRLGVRFAEAFEGKANGRILTMFGPHAPYTCSSDLLMEVKELAKKHRIGIHVHVSETQQEVQQLIERHNMPPVEYLDSIGFLGPEVLAAHCVWLNQREIGLLRDRGVKPVHNPVSNMKFGCGVAPVAQMLGAGIPVALGTDGPASNNSLDMFKEMKFAALLSKVHGLDPTAVPAGTALEMATINGATALGLQDKIGSIEVGKKADLIVVDVHKPHLAPLHGVVSNLVYSATGSDVDTVIVDGKILMQDREVLTLDEERVLELAQRTSDDLLAREARE